MRKICVDVQISNVQMCRLLHLGTQLCMPYFVHANEMQRLYLQKVNRIYCYSSPSSQIPG